MSLSSKKQDRCEYGSVIRECSFILCNEDGFNVHFVRRQANEIAHVLAKLSCSIASPMTWHVWHVTPYHVLYRMIFALSINKLYFKKKNIYIYIYIYTYIYLFIFIYNNNNNNNNGIFISPKLGIVLFLF